MNRGGFFDPKAPKVPMLYKYANRPQDKTGEHIRRHEEAVRRGKKREEKNR